MENIYRHYGVLGFKRHMSSFYQYPVEAVLFDWDMTLGAALGGVSLAERIAALFQQVGLAYDSQAIAKAIDRRKQAIEEGQLRGQVTPQEKEQILLYYRHLLDILGHPELSHQLIEQIYLEYAHLPFIFYRDTLPALQTLAQRGFRLGIITNHTPNIRPIIEENLGELILPEHIMISGELNLYKPDQAIFTKAATHLETPVEKCIYIGDNLVVDAIGAVTAGRYACGLWCNRSGQSPSTVLPSHVYQITGLDQVLDFVSNKKTLSGI